MAKAKKPKGKVTKFPTKCESADCEDIKAFVARLGITMGVMRADDNPNWRAPYEADHWRVTLRLGRRKLETFYSLLLAHDGREPGVEEVLHCLALDAVTIDRFPTFEAWFDEFGYVTDSQGAEANYKTAKADHAKLRKLIGDEFKTLLAAAEA